MTPDTDPLPEGTDAVIEGAGVAQDDEDTGEDEDEERPEPAHAGAAKRTTGARRPAVNGAEATPDLRSAFVGRVEALRGSAGDRARDVVEAGKDRATTALDDLVRMVEDAAGEIDAKIGTNYGDYARRAAGSIDGLAGSIRGKDADALIADARALVQKSPGVSIGIAAALGFVVARLVRAGVPEKPDAVPVASRNR